MAPRVAIAGIGGFGAAHHEVFKKLEAEGRVKVTATCDPALVRLGEICQKYHFSERGVQTYTSFEKMLEHHGNALELGVIAAPPNVHASMHEAFVNRGVTCYLEKPPTLDLEELHRMIATDQHAAKCTNVGFRFIHDASRLELKKRMQQGEFGALRETRLLALSHRTPAYFQRSNWAGRLMLDNRLLLDSCLGNALAHFVNSVLFFADLTQAHTWARPRTMASELYRANPIEGTDTIFASGQLENGVNYRIAATHACDSTADVIEEILIFEKATVTLRNITEGSIERLGHPPEQLTLAQPTLEDCVRDYMQFFEGNAPMPPQTLADSLGFVETNALFYLAAGGRIHKMAQDALGTDLKTSAIVISDIADVATHFVANAEFPSHNKQCAWGRCGGDATAGELEALPQVIRYLRG